MPSTTTPNTKPLLLSPPSLLSVVWQLTSFAELSAYQIYNIIQAREQVFVKDQDCSYIDADGLDFEALHLSAYQGDAESESIAPQLLAYCRILMPINFDNHDIQQHSNTSHPRIGRVLVLADYRGYGLARELMIRAIDYCHLQLPKQPIHISAQTYLIEFYQSLGFICDGVAFEEQGIEHIHMSLDSL
ncbi:ElaA protein [Psychrobacter sp. PL15]|uniref:GNAT family N-acetyltransferase n=1 Tax=unclassified Psychrobacter TaxID=196806 RepID=UPI001AE20886|nr:GNAT family N-acetyltransferase [Psychrobacter sp. PL15]MEC5211174.1 ElaA protein [Psychrobacter sp. PL15]